MAVVCSRKGRLKNFFSKKMKRRFVLVNSIRKTLGRIKDIVSADGNEVEVTHPMEKLESFFVNIVTKARQEAQTTSGAEQGTGISGFLAEKPVVRKETILDQLVSADVTSQPQKQSVTDTTTKTSESPKAPTPVTTDTDLLSKLSEKTTPAPESEVTEKPITQDVSSGKQEEKPSVRTDVLDDLIGKKDDGKTETIRHDDAEDASNA